MPSPATLNPSYRLNRQMSAARGDRMDRTMMAEVTPAGRKALIGCTRDWPLACRERFPVSRWAWCERCFGGLTGVVSSSRDAAS